MKKKTLHVARTNGWQEQGPVSGHTCDYKSNYHKKNNGPDTWANKKPQAKKCRIY